ncbi:MAG: hypothetical protein HYZ34_09970 [Ignavibacteriae bacterium]|nr:hypothetical protein [Ignavibacteriota bacterium]
MNIFNDKKLSLVLENHLRKLRSEVESQNDNYLLNVNETEFINYLVKEYTVNNVEIDPSGVYVSHLEKYISAEYFPRDFNVYAGRSYKKNVVKYHIPFQGDTELLKCVPSSRILWTTDITIEEDCICFEIISFRDDAEEIKKEADHRIGNILRQASCVKTEVESFNSNLRSQAEQVFRARKERILKTSNFLASLGVPLKKKENYLPTFAIPSPQINRSVNINKPKVNETGFKPEPALDNSTYNDILQVVHDVGKQFERMPSTYANKQEEDLRDHFLLYLEPRFQGSSTGETFNKSGKTDIIIRYEGKNAFIAECKFWKGSKTYLDTINQLLRYLTWRDSKAAIILFVRNKDFSSVIGQIELTTPQHPNFLGFVGNIESTWFNYRFHINGDRNREVKLAIVLFHFPDLATNAVGGN